MNNEAKLLEVVAEILEVDSVDLDYELGDSEWDSIAVVTFISEADSEFDVIVSAKEVSEATKVADLLKLISK